ncbi:hypothetical protein A8B78_11100 [Jannaschia sp. EhC01]|nr:hypothetical protein A8B78_11100 [Jannaschia sp. EhC01]
MVFDARNMACIYDQVTASLLSRIDDLRSNIQMQITAESNLICRQDAVRLSLVVSKAVEKRFRLFNLGACRRSRHGVNYADIDYRRIVILCGAAARSRALVSLSVLLRSTGTRIRESMDFLRSFRPRLALQAFAALISVYWTDPRVKRA